MNPLDGGRGHAAGGGTSRSIAPLLSPFEIGRLDLRNRVVMAPMTRDRSPGGVPGEEVAEYYARRAEADVGLIVTEGTWVDHPVASNRPNAPRFYGEDALAGWSKVVDRVHAVGGRIFPQLWHVGAVRSAEGDERHPDRPSMGPSGSLRHGPRSGDEPSGQPMTQAEIEGVVDAFGAAAASAFRLGFDGLEIHGAHGYLIDQFFSPVTNLRVDAYGGSVERRSRFAAEVVRACRRRTAPDFPIALRFSQWKVGDYDARPWRDPAELAAFLEPLVDAGVDIFHCSTRRFWDPAFAGDPLTLAGWTKRLSGRAVIAVGSVGLSSEFSAVSAGAGEMAAEPRSLDGLLDYFERGEFDLVAVGRALLTDPNWLEKISRGATEELVSYDATSRSKFL